MKQQVFISSGKNIDQIDVSKLGNGIYFLELGKGANRQTRKFIVQH
jgi:Secretion system C-terminal sorting domain